MKKTFLIALFLCSACGGAQWHSRLTAGGVEHCQTFLSGTVCEEVILPPWTGPNPAAQFADDDSTDIEILVPEDFR